MTMTVDHALVGERLRELRDAAGDISQQDAADALGLSQATYSRIESGDRALKGAELVVLADLIGVRAAAITGVSHLRQHARMAARTDGTEPQTTKMRDQLYAYLELDSYLTGQGVAAT